MQNKAELLWYPKTVNRYILVAPETTETMLQDTAEQFAHCRAISGQVSTKAFYLISLTMLHRVSTLTAQRRKKKKVGSERTTLVQH